MQVRSRVRWNRKVDQEFPVEFPIEFDQKFDWEFSVGTRIWTGFKPRPA
jgi:hypothetical protein